MAHNYSNTASTAQLDAPLNSSANSFQVTGFTGYPAAPFFILMDRDTSSAELMEVTQVSASTLTVTRGAGGTAATSHSAGATVEHVIPAAVPQAVEQHTEATTNIHGVTGSLVGSETAGTLSNKTYRGAHVHVYSDTEPDAPAGGFVVTADTSSSRDGFIAAGTGANTDRAGFLLTQSGAERFKARYDGTVQITPSGASARPALEVLGSVELDTLVTDRDVTIGEDLSVAGLVSANAITAPNINATSGLAVTGNVTASQITASGLVTSSSSNVTGNASVGGALSVTGTGGITMTSNSAYLKFPTGYTAATAGTAEGQVRQRGGTLEVWNGEKWINQGGVDSVALQDVTDGGHVTGQRARFRQVTMDGYGAGIPYKVFAQAQLEINNTTEGRRWDLFLVYGDDWTDDSNSFASGVGPGFTQTGVGLRTISSGGPIDIHLVVRRTVGSGGSCDVTAFNQMLTIWTLPALF